MKRFMLMFLSSYKPNIFILLFPLTFYCTPLPELVDFDAELWKSDKGGCNGSRIGQITNLMDQKDKIMGLDQPHVIKLIGNPDEHELSKRLQKFFIYHISGGEKCQDSQDSQTNNTKLSIRFDALGKANEVVFYSK